MKLMVGYMFVLNKIVQSLSGEVAGISVSLFYNVSS